MERPNQVRIGPFDWEIRWLDKPTIDLLDGGRINGYVQYTHLVVMLSLELKPQALAATFMHEVVHAIVWTARAVSEENKLEEDDMCFAVSRGLVSLWRDNPNLMQWWQGLLNQSYE